jgi:vacuolar-type H+-ATPase catalytic subunit A/Vma1
MATIDTLYQWWPIRRTRQVLRKLSLVPVEIRLR